MLTDPDALRHRARQLGVETSFWDVSGTLHHASDTTIAAIVDVLEADAAAHPVDATTVIVARPGEAIDVGVDEARVELVDGGDLLVRSVGGRLPLPEDAPFGVHRLVRPGPGGDLASTLVVAPWLMPRDPRLGDRTSSLFVPAYALWETDRPLPSYRLLHRGAELIARHGIGILSTLPLYAAFLDDPFDPSPYAPVSRLHWNEVYVDDDVLAPGPDVPSRELIDWPVLGARRRAQLIDTARTLDGDTVAALARFVVERPDVADYARFQTARGAATDAGPPEALVRRSYELGQFFAHRQLAAVDGDGRAVLALDLPIGSHPAGYETWADPDLFAPGMSVGAPPDDFFVEGQNWGFPPQLPVAGRAAGHELWRAVVARAGEHTSMLRIDHVMGVHRLWWVPEGASAADGAYVRYPREELLAVIAAEATRTGTTIVGEDLGTVPDEVREALDRWDMIGLFEEEFHLFGDDLPTPPRHSVAGLRTHDMSAFAATVDGHGLTALEGYRQRLECQVGHPVEATADALVDGALERLAASEADVVVADLDDLTGERRPHNVPGVVSDTTWRRRLPAPLGDVLGDDTVRRRLQLVAARGGS